MHTIVRQSIDMMIVAPGHGMIVDQRVHHSLFCRFHHPGKNRVEQIIRNCLNGMRDLITVRDIPIGG